MTASLLALILWIFPSKSQGEVFKSLGAARTETNDQQILGMTSNTYGQMKGQAWLAFGDLRGHIEPCGCDPATDLGGIRRIDTLIQRERKSAPHLKVFCLGDLFKADLKDESQIKNEFILRALSQSGIEATLIGPSEVYNIKLLEQIKAKDPGVVARMNFLLSNAKKDKVELYRSSVESENYRVFGYYYEERFDGLLEKWSIDKFVDLVKRTDQKSTRQPKHKVLLFRGTKELLSQITQRDLFDVIISGNRAPQDQIPAQDEKQDEDKLKILSNPLVLQVPLGGQGFLRGGILQNHASKSIRDLLSEGAVKSDDSSKNNLFTNQRHIVTWLTPQVEDSPQLSKIFSEYESQIKKAFQKSGGDRIKDLALSPFGGVESCKTCHSVVVDVYQVSRHARAMDTLVKKGKEQDPYCVSCHSVGFNEKGGFVSIKDSPFLSHVQCENCHGPRKQHALQPIVETQDSRKARGEMARKVCVQCHNPQHSPKFNFDTYWDKIKHYVN